MIATPLAGQDAPPPAGGKNVFDFDNDDEPAPMPVKPETPAAPVTPTTPATPNWPMPPRRTDPPAQPPAQPVQPPRPELNPTPPPMMSSKQPLPDAAALQAAHKEVRDAFPELNDANSNPRITIPKLVRESRSAANAWPVRYALLETIAASAEKIGDIGRVRYAINDMGRYFTGVNMGQLKLDAAKRLNHSAANPAEIAYLMLDGALNAAEGGQPELSAPALGPIDAILKKVTDDQALKGLTERAGDLRRAQAAAEAVKPHRAALKTNPNDPAANVMVGWFACVIARDWNNGITMLAKGNNQSLKAVAEKELSYQPDPVLEAADGWWDLAAAPTTSEADRPYIRMHAADLYRRHRTSAAGLKQVTLDNRVRESSEERAAMTNARYMGRVGYALTGSGSTVTVRPPGVVGGSTINPPAAPRGPKQLGEPTATAEIDATIKRGVEYLLAQQKDGSWDTVAPNAGTAGADGSQWGGTSAMVAYALLCAGEDPKTNPQLAAAIDWQKKAKVNGTYALGFRALLWNELAAADPAGYKDVIRTDANSLGEGAVSKGVPDGMWHYTPQARSYDHSTSQYGLLGMTLLERNGINVPPALWQAADKQWKDNQRADGTWAYMPGSTNTYSVGRSLNMTAAGVASLLITQDYLRSPDPIRKAVPNPWLDRGMAWLDTNLNEALNGSAAGGSMAYYGMYGLMRIGEMTGAKTIGKIDWYQDGAARVMRQQSSTGSWSSVPNTAFVVIFLSHGRKPVVMNKLQYKIDGKDANWNARWRDATIATRYASKLAKQDYRWQNVTLDTPADLMDSPVLYISGGTALKFTPDEQAKLKKHIEAGGIIVGNTEAADQRFSNSFRELAKALTGDEMKKLDPAHPLFDRQRYNGKPWRTKPEAEAATLNTRPACILLPGDIGKALHFADEKTREEQFQLFNNVLAYGQSIRSK